MQNTFRTGDKMKKPRKKLRVKFKYIRVKG